MVMVMGGLVITAVVAARPINIAIRMTFVVSTTITAVITLTVLVLVLAGRFPFIPQTISASLSFPLIALPLGTVTLLFQFVMLIS